MTNEQIEILIKAFILIINLAIVLYFKPFIDSKISSADQERLINFIKISVRCAEQIYTPDEWAKKKLYVYGLACDFMNEKLNTKLTDKELDALIEGLVNEVKHGE